MSEPARPTPEDEGIPDHADDTSTAYGEAERPRFNDSPASLPADEPQGVDEFGVTAPEARQGEPLSRRLEREEPEEPAEPGGEPSTSSAARGGPPAEEEAMHELPEDESPDRR